MKIVKHILFCHFHFIYILQAPPSAHDGATAIDADCQLHSITNGRISQEDDAIINGRLSQNSNGRLPQSNGNGRLSHPNGRLSHNNNGRLPYNGNGRISYSGSISTEC